MECGCKISIGYRSKSGQDTAFTLDTIEFCPLHKAAADMLAALKYGRDLYENHGHLARPVPGKDLDPGRWINSVRDIIALVESNTPDRSFIQSPVNDVFQVCDRPRRVHPGHIKIEEREGTPQYTDYSAPSSYPIPDHSFIQSPLMTGGCLKCDRPSWVHPGQVKIEEPESKS
jgi:hypothetical protein